MGAKQLEIADKFIGLLVSPKRILWGSRAGDDTHNLFAFYSDDNYLYLYERLYSADPHLYAINLDDLSVRYSAGKYLEAMGLYTQVLYTIFFRVLKDRKRNPSPVVSALAKLYMREIENKIRNLKPAEIPKFDLEYEVNLDRNKYLRFRFSPKRLKEIMEIVYIYRFDNGLIVPFPVLSSRFGQLFNDVKIEVCVLKSLVDAFEENNYAEEG